MSAQAERAELALPAINRRGRAVVCRVTITPLIGIAQEVIGAILMMDTLNEGDGEEASA